ncbi:MAG: hypothetical protein KC620_08030 [Myxococcales bacterium]|nr:hypothetical protein [Myxococcales bacterium]
MRPAIPQTDRHPRSLAIAWLLTLIMPGLGHIYCGLLVRGLVVWTAFFTACAVALLAWAHWLFMPFGPLVVATASWMALQMALLADLRRFIEGPGVAYQLRPVNHPVSYLGVLLGLGVLPVLIVALAVGNWMIGSVEVRSLAMFPKSLPGDHVLYERDDFAARPPVPGELIVLDAAPEGPRIARVVAVGRGVVQLRDGRPLVDGRAFDRTPLDALRVPRFDAGEQARLDALVGYLESSLAGRYVVTFDRARSLDADPAPVTLAEDELFVLGDNRGVALAEGVYGKVRVGAIRGRPRSIWASYQLGAGMRSGRVGLAVR